MTLLVMAGWDFHEYGRSKKSYVNKALSMLENHPLDRRLGEDYFMSERPEMCSQGEHSYHDAQLIFHRVYQTQLLPEGVWHFGGNFFDYSFAFSFYTDEPELIAQFKEAIRKNIASEGYRLQQPPAEHRLDTEIVEPIITDWVNFFTQNGTSDHYRVYGEDGKLLRIRKAK